MKVNFSQQKDQFLDTKFKVIFLSMVKRPDQWRMIKELENISSYSVKSGGQAVKSQKHIQLASFRSAENLSNFSSTGSMWAMIRLTFEKLENFSCIFFPFKSVKYSGRIVKLFKIRIPESWGVWINLGRTR